MSILTFPSVFYSFDQTTAKASFMVNSITSKSDSVQIVYENYLANKYIVNRRYQRKLVWTQQEKSAFIDSLLNQYSVPLFLLAQNTDSEGVISFEIIDGMQRLNSIAAFIENEYPILWEGRSCFFDLDTLASTLNLKQQGVLRQNQPLLPREVCMRIVSYQIPFSYIIADQQSIEEIFRRINSYGKQLSGQEIRQAGAIGVFSDLVRKISSTIRGDVSIGDKLSLNEMKKISLSNVNLKYGIDIDQIWWVKQHIVTVPNIRVSRDEELIAWILSYIILGKEIAPTAKTLNRLYRYDFLDQEGNNLASIVESRIMELGDDYITKCFCNTFSVILDVLHESGRDFRTLVFSADEAEGLVRTFQVVFLAFYELLYKEHKKISNMSEVIKHLDNLGMSLLKGIVKDPWTADSRYDRIQAVKGVLSPYFKEVKGEDVAKDSWVLEIDNIMRLSTLEGAQYDYKAGFHNFTDSKFNEDLVKRCVRLLTAAVNKGPNTHGYVIVGVCETAETYNTFKRFYNTNVGTRFQNTDLYVTGIDEEVKRFYKGSYDMFQNAIISIIMKEPVDAAVRHYLTTHIRFPKYYGVTLLMIDLVSGEEPITYGDEYYERQGNNAVLVKGIKGKTAIESRFASGV